MAEVVNIQHYDGAESEVVFIDRRSQFGNQFVLKEDGGGYSRAESIRAYREWFKSKIRDDSTFRDAVEELKGETLACHCRPRPCHGDVILEYIEGNMNI